jgi:hypothetical protein
MIGRRSVLKLLGLAPAAAPLAAKAAADAEIAKLTGINVGASAGFYPTHPGPGGSLGFDEYNKLKIAAAGYSEVGGIPEFVREQLWRNAQYVSYLDPDLASKRSWSMAVKIQTQRERNFQRQLESVRYSGRHATASMAFKKLTGWDWPW